MPAPVPIRNPKVPEQRRLPIEAGGEARMVDGEVKSRKMASRWYDRGGRVMLDGKWELVGRSEIRGDNPIAWRGNESRLPFDQINLQPWDESFILLKSLMNSSYEIPTKPCLLHKDRFLLYSSNKRFRFIWTTNSFRPEKISCRKVSNAWKGNV